MKMVVHLNNNQIVSCSWLNYPYSTHEPVVKVKNRHYNVQVFQNDYAKVCTLLKNLSMSHARLHPHPLPHPFFQMDHACQDSHWSRIADKSNCPLNQEHAYMGHLY